MKISRSSPISEHRLVASHFLGKVGKQQCTLHVVGRFEHFKRSTVAQFLDLVGVNYVQASETPFFGDQHAYIYWHNRYNEPPPVGLSERLSLERKRIINLTMFSHDKKRSDEVFADVFGYRLDIDPQNYQGEGVIKGRHDNGAKSARAVRYPLDDAIDTDKNVYQIMVKNDIEFSGNGYSYLYRVPIFDGHIPIMIGKHFKKEDRFAWSAAGAEMICPYSALTPPEIRLIREYCLKFGLEFGELDVLRDMDTNRIYIIDANATPYPHDEWVVKEDRTFLQIMATSALERWWPRIFIPQS